jgi:hypothetical protein
MINKPWYREMTAQDTDAILHALAAEVAQAAERLIDAGWGELEAYRLASVAAVELGAGWPGWEKVKAVKLGLNA